MNYKQLQKALKNKKIYILSPHFDDAVLSCGMLIYTLKGKADITVINIFTNSHNGPYTFSAKKFLKTAGYSDASKLYEDRMKEDRLALEFTGAKSREIGLTDSLFRRHGGVTKLGKIFPEIDHVYPTYRWHILKDIAKKDYASKSLERNLRKFIPQNAIVFAPFGIGNHVDHKLTRIVAEKLFRNLFYYTDFPYNIRNDESGKLPDGYERVSLPTLHSIKNKLISMYVSQKNGLFPMGVIPRHKEVFFIRTVNTT
jgi:LmbE family N-acetylglucosaminyl deacetylase